MQDISKNFNLNTKNLADRIRIEEDYTAAGVLEVYLESTKPKEDEKLLKELSDLFVNYATIQKQKKLSEGLSFLSAQEPAIKEKNYRLRDELEKFMQDNNIVEPVAQSQTLKDEIAMLESGILKLKSKTKRLGNIKEELLKGELNKTNFFAETINYEDTSFQINNPEQEIANQYQILNLQLSEALLTYTPNSAKVRNIESRIKSLEPLIREKQIESVERAIKANKDYIELNQLRLNKLKSEFEELTALIKEFSILEFELDASTNSLDGINRTKEKLQFDLAQDTKPWTLIKQPRFKPTRIYPSYKRELTNFILLGSFFGVILALLRDKFDNVYHSPKEIQNDIKGPVLGNIPYVDFFADIREQKKSILNTFSGKTDDEEINSYEKFFYQEALRNIYTSIRFTNSDNPLKVITLTSSIPKEGKSLTNILLAKTLCEMDLKILQIDADLRKPQLHLRLGLNNITGLSNILTDKKISISEAIQSVPGFKNWDVITSGTLPPDPTRILKSKSMEDFIKSLKKDNNYDLVLIDTPPVIGLADSLLVSEKSDGLILIVSTNKVPRSLPKESINRTLESGAYFIGIITNETKKPQSELINNYAYGSYNYSYTYNSYFENDEASNKLSKEQTKVEKIKDSFLKNLSSISSKVLNWLDN